MKINLIVLVVALALSAASCNKANRPISYSVGEEAYGGIVIKVSDGGLHGLVVAKVDQVLSTDYLDYDESLELIATYSEGGTAWRLPNKEELELIYTKKASLGTFRNWYYWSSTKNGNFPWACQFGVNAAYPSNFKCPNNGFNSRAVKDF
ncbi:MAG: hypothetical protein NT109_08830 [Flavobacteriia bacterium]|nr:hypothetical protein [Flavobacteriia bacterium]